ncbi:putative L-type amino acid transporter 1-like protein MLAS [Acanthaster planci]|uniref:L-type amino acid transporter 1-like protein MLAS n=1 Tax=Acanthaster planci TaxID=133434 RepID=A0A8B7ZJC0_ACAPL|nr:putative L-type amino acid transporter 1-like protein MLAS [Acanthaster planci]
MDETNGVRRVSRASASSQRQTQADNISVHGSAGSADRVGLKRQIGLAGCIAFVVGTVIGSGIFISPKGVLQNTGSVGLSLMVWVACGILSAIGALCYAELGTMISKSGGDFTYILDSFGPVPAFLRIWTLIVAVRTASFAVLVITASTYLIGPFFGECGVPVVVIQLLGAAIIGKNNSEENQQASFITYI